jgi:LytR cell envelope-related transcriptional attenuator
MEQSMSMPPPETLVRPWRTATIVASTVAAFELVLILILGVVLLGKPLSERMRDTAQQRTLGIETQARPKPKIGSSKPQLARGETSVIVLNGNGVSGAAHATAAQVEARGYSIGDVGNANRTDYTRSVVMYRPGYRGEAMRLARDLRIRIVGPLDGMNVRQLMGAHVAVVVGS